MAGSARPYKVWNGDRQVKKSVTACSLAELIQKGCAKLSLIPSESLRVVWEEDGTEVDDEDYFAFLPTNSTLMFLSGSERWRPRGLEDIGRDEPDHAGNLENLEDATIQQLTQELKPDISRIITFSSEQLQLLVDCGTPRLAQLLGETERFAHCLQEGCQRHLDDRMQTTEAVDLLRLYHKSQQVSPYVNMQSETKKRKADEET